MSNMLNRYSLEYEKTSVYVKDQLESGNTLSRELLKSLDFEQGQFFTLLPLNANLKRVYKFPFGGILEQNEIQDYINESGSKSYFSWTPTIKEDLSQFLLKKMKLKSTYACLFEDILRTPKKSIVDFHNHYGVTYSNEVYYLFLNSNISEKLILSGINNSNAIWHQVFIITEIENQNDLCKQITMNDIKRFCLKTNLLIVGAYDGEGFILWEPNEKAK